ncbi:DUF6191 domain-containing protein [Streptomyces sp. CdTB01]|uniref:DUF6191 domain-containing protein n=1 Tax=Streptomyces sp. CdTB01 TaxID=1725411 RepID=UPI000B225FD3|nr:DUF6191 domain-containing protein [Streptomyces sp. CdTB01]
MLDERGWTHRWHDGATLRSASREPTHAVREGQYLLPFLVQTKWRAFVHDGAPPNRTTVDLDGGTAVVRMPRRDR